MSAAAAIKHDARGFYIPRAEMPQIDEADLPHLVATAFDAGHAPAFQAVAPASLHAHQRVNHALALSMSDEVKLKPALVSADGYVLDGNHRWWAHVHAGDQLMNVIRIGLPFDDALAWLFEQPYSYRITPTTPQRN